MENGKGLIHEQPLDNGNGGLAILVGGFGEDSPKGFMDNIVKEYVGGTPYNDFIDISLSNPYVRIVTKGINDINFEEFDPAVHSLGTLKKRK